MDLFNFWDSSGDSAPTTVSTQLAAEQYAWDSGFAQQSPQTLNDAPGSWTGTSSLPQVIRDLLAVVNTGLGVSLAKDQFAASRDTARANLAGQVAQAQGNAAVTRAQAALAANQAAMAARHPNGVPFGTTRNDQLMILIGVAGLLFAYMQTIDK